MSGKKVATLVIDEDANVSDITRIIDDRLEYFDGVQCVSNQDGTYDVIRTDIE